MKVKTSELVGPALDYAVALCGTVPPKTEGFRNSNNILRLTVYLDYRCDWKGNLSAIPYSPSTDWAQGGPIIEREDISFRKYHNPGKKAHGKFYAMVCRESGTIVHWKGWGTKVQTGPTPLIAAMRCYVASKLGDEVDLPEKFTHSRLTPTQV